MTERSFVYATDDNPDVTDNKITAGSGNGIFNASITDLTSNTKCYVRADAVNSAGTSYGSEIDFTTDTI